MRAPFLALATLEAQNMTHNEAVCRFFFEKMFPLLRVSQPRDTYCQLTSMCSGHLSFHGASRQSASSKSRPFRRSSRQAIK